MPGGLSTTFIVLLQVVLPQIERDLSAANDPSLQPPPAVVTGGPTHRWSVAGFLTMRLGGSAGQLESHLRRAGYFHGPLLGSGRPTPYSDSDPAGALDVQFRVYNRWSVGLTLATSSQRTVGFNQSFGSVGIDQKVRTVGLVFSRSFVVLRGRGDAELEVGIGPARHLVRSRQNDSSAGPWQRHSTDGFVAQAAFGVASGGRLQLLMQVGVLYRYIGRSEVGPYSATSLGFGPGPPVARTSVSNSDWIIKVGSGLRF